MESARERIDDDTETNTDDDAPPTDWLAELPPELHLRILEGVDDFSDCAAFSLASPRLGLLALRSGLARFKDPLFAVAMRLLLIQRFAGGFGVVTLSEDTLRRYAADRRASADNFPWLARASPALCLSSEVEGAGERRIEVWRLRRDESGAKLRSRFLQSGQVKHFEGERGAERKVRMEFSDGEVRYYEGMKGAERVVRAVRADGAVQHFEGERGAERMVRVEFLSGIVLHYEGEQGAERKVRAESANGDVQYFEGGRGAERCVREKYPDGTVQYFEGESGGPHGVVQRWLSRPGVREKVLAAIAEKGLDAAIALAASVALDGEDWV